MHMVPHTPHRVHDDAQLPRLSKHRRVDLAFELLRQQGCALVGCPNQMIMEPPICHGCSPGGECRAVNRTSQNDQTRCKRVEMWVVACRSIECRLEHDLLVVNRFPTDFHLLSRAIHRTAAAAFRTPAVRAAAISVRALRSHCVMQSVLRSFVHDPFNSRPLAQKTWCQSCLRTFSTFLGQAFRPVHK